MDKVRNIKGWKQHMRFHVKMKSGWINKTGNALNASVQDGVHISQY